MSLEDCPECTTYIYARNPFFGEPVFIARYFALGFVRSHQHRLLLTTLDLCKEEDRRKTFCGDWIGQNASATTAAAAGFYYLGDRDRLQCFSCGRMIDNWMHSSDPVDEHGKVLPSCAMTLGMECRNIPASQEMVTSFCHFKSVPKWKDLTFVFFMCCC